MPAIAKEKVLSDATVASLEKAISEFKRQGGYDKTDDKADAKVEAMAGAKEDVAENRLEGSIRTMKKPDAEEPETAAKSPAADEAKAAAKAKAPAKPKSAKKKP
jgi:hypothetical protein